VKIDVVITEPDAVDPGKSIDEYLSDRGRDARG